ncbi:bifunctional DNA primase/polymerase [Streptomyces sp. H27-C3]|uniref:bifunctional DNA primase/polymerase n=1 Tax=Streptomyces sp. H27-C3 TaxID=3046305 RepID=UPI0024BAEB96|nr:bifunctional DNA primase/polymerase [Streptomyces sp. H27-C3]MDJ0463446.1 bifunctional DNA primase/polymerase [Streptomyces sp. H27-C3]
MATTDRRAATLALAHALSAAERGLPVIPLSRTKLPALRSPHRDSADPIVCRGECGQPGHGVHDASTDPATVRALFAAAPWATGYGIACGRTPHHLVGIDLDTKPDPDATVSGTGAYAAPSPAPGAPGPTTSTTAAPDSTAALRHLALQHLFTIPETVVVLTPSGGRHLWLTAPPEVVVPNSASRLAPGIDIRGAGGYLVGPGSLTTRGIYRTAPGTAHLAPAACPGALLRLIAPPARPHHPTDRPGPHAEPPGRGHGLVQFVLAAHEGQRNTRLFWAACRAHENGLGPALTDALTEAAVRTGLTEREARATIASAARLSTTS